MKKTKPPNEVEHYNAIMIEDLHSKIDLVVEGLEGLRSEMKSEFKTVRSEIAALRNDMNSKFSLAYAATRCNADDIRANANGIQGNATNIQELRTKLEAMHIDVKYLSRDMLDAKSNLRHIIKLVENHEQQLMQVTV